MTPGTNLTYAINIHNAGPSNAVNTVMTESTPLETTFVSITAPAGWSCANTPPVGGTGQVQCTHPNLPPGDYAITFVVKVDPGAVGSILNQGLVLSSTPTDNPSGGAFNDTTTIGAPVADISLAKTDSPNPVEPGANITYTITFSNAGPSNSGQTQLDDTLPAGTTFVSLSAPAGWSCVTPNVGSGGQVTCTHGSAPLGNSVFTLVVKVDPATPDATVISNTASVTVAQGVTDPNPGDTVATTGTTVSAPDGGGGDGGSPVDPIPALDWRGLLVLGVLLAALGAAWMRRS
ncbi:MAG TPA: DUF11 domain-containing protein [Thermoanaerobaculia bacterium]|nr:DUF11 domain-containing protein [Thermoanaerobaculia bacterium]